LTRSTSPNTKTKSFVDTRSVESGGLTAPSTTSSNRRRTHSKKRELAKNRLIYSFEDLEKSMSEDKAARVFDSIGLFAKAATKVKESSLLEAINTIVENTIEKDSQSKFEELLEVLCDKEIDESPFVGSQAMLHANKIKAYRELYPLIRPKEFMQLLGRVSKNPSRDASSMVKESEVFSFKLGKNTEYPAFQINEKTHSVHYEIPEVINMLDYLDGKSIYYWFCAYSDSLGAPPVELLGNKKKTNALFSYASQTKHRALD
jgi:hypothetical protein